MEATPSVRVLSPGAEASEALINVWMPPTGKSGVDAALVVLRLLAGFTGDEHQNQELDKTHPLLGAQWTHLDKSLGQKQKHDAWEKVSERLLKDLAANKIDDLSFIGLMEGEPMLRALWSRPHLQLCRPIKFEASVSTPGMLHKPDEDDIHGAQDSLIKWDGQQALSDLISGRFGTQDQDAGECPSSGKSVQQRRIMPNNPLVLRVLYTPATDDSPRIPAISSTTCGLPEHLATGEDVAEFRAQNYNLVAVVRLRQSETGLDCVRTYALDGFNIRPPVEFDLDETEHIDLKFRAGELGASYMLYYFQVAEPVPIIPEVIEHPKGRAQFIKSLSDMMASGPANNGSFGKGIMGGVGFGKR